MNETEARRVAAVAGEAVSGPDRSGWFDRLEPDRGALAEAVIWYLDRDDADTALRIVVDVWRFWEQRGHLTEGRRIIGMALERGSRAEQGIRGQAYAAATALAFRQGDNDTAASLVETRSISPGQPMISEPSAPAWCGRRASPGDGASMRWRDSASKRPSPSLPRWETRAR